MSQKPQAHQDAIETPVTNLWVNGAAYGFAVIVLFVADEIFKNEFNVVTAALIAAAIPIAAYDFFVAKVHRRASAGLGPVNGSLDWGRIATKLLAFYATIGVLALAYMLVPIYDRSRFAAFFIMVNQALPFVLILAVPFTAAVDQRMRAPRDASWEMGQLLLFRIKGRDWAAIKTYGLGWAIKGFFLPIMAANFISVSDQLISATFSFYFLSIPNFYFFLFKLVLFVDLSIAVLGYLMTTRVLDAHIRSANPLFWGWAVTLVCYYPFWGILYGNVLTYNDGTNWVGWLGGTGPLLLLWAAVILFFKIAWMWANLTFGLRFSNLTHRGILTHGAFRFTKHPSYVSKNIAWWMISMPFLSVAGWEAALVNSAALLGVNCLYLLRARAEEIHLSEDPVYVAYALEMNDKGVFRWISYLVPALAYRAPTVTNPTAPRDLSV